MSALGATPSEVEALRFVDELGAAGPLVEPDDDPGRLIVTFCWYDREAEEVLLFVNRLTDETDLGRSLMGRAGSTGLWTLSYRMEPDWRASYSFLPRRAGQAAPWRDASDQPALRHALDRGAPDPRNPDTCRNRAGVLQSVVSLPGAPRQRWLDERVGGSAGTVEEREGPGGRRVWVYSPPTVPLAAEGLGTVVVLDGDVWCSTQQISTTLDNLIADGEIAPVRALLVDAGDREQRWSDLGADSRIVEYVADDLLGWARRELRTSADPTAVTVVGQSLGGLSALRTVLARPDAVANAVVQSASLWSDDPVARLGTDAAAAGASRVYLEVGRQEWVLLDAHRRTAAALEASGVETRSVEFNGGHDYACWRGGVAEGLRWAVGVPSGQGAGTRSCAT